MDLEISPGIVRKTFTMLVSLGSGQSLAIELPGNFNTPTPGRLLQTAIYGDVRHLNEVRPIDRELNEWQTTGVQVAIKTIRRDMLEGGKLYNARLCENPLKEISVMQHIASQHRA